MAQLSAWHPGVLIGTLALVGCEARAPQPEASAYVVALQSVLTDVQGNPPAGPLDLSPASAAQLDSTTLRALAAAGVVPPSCRRVRQIVVGCEVAQRGLQLIVSPLRTVSGGRLALDVVVRGRAAPGDQTVIVGRPYQAYIELAPAPAGWRIARKVRSGGPGATAA
jgi:hypothetical protein